MKTAVVCGAGGFIAGHFVKPLRGNHLARHGAFALLVHRGDGLDDAQLGAMIVGGLGQGRRVFGKARAAESGTGVEKFLADAVVHRHDLRGDA